MTSFIHDTAKKKVTFWRTIARTGFRSPQVPIDFRPTIEKILNGNDSQGNAYEAHRATPIGDEEFIERLYVPSGELAIAFNRSNRRRLPEKETDRKKSQLTFRPNEGLVEAGIMVGFDDEVAGLILPDDVAVTRIASFIKDKGKMLNRYVNIVPLLDHSVREKLDSGDEVTVVELSLSREEMGWLPSSDNSKIRRSLETPMEVYPSVGKATLKLEFDRATSQEDITDLKRTLTSIYDIRGLFGRKSRAKATIVDDDSTKWVLDLLSQSVSVEKEILLKPGRTKALEENAAALAIVEAYAEIRTTINDAVGRWYNG